MPCPRCHLPFSVCECESEEVEVASKTLVVETKAVDHPQPVDNRCPFDDCGRVFEGNHCGCGYDTDPSLSREVPVRAEALV